MDLRVDLRQKILIYIKQEIAKQNCAKENYLHLTLYMLYSFLRDFVSRKRLKPLTIKIKNEDNQTSHGRGNYLKNKVRD